MCDPLTQHKNRSCSDSKLLRLVAANRLCELAREPLDVFMRRSVTFLALVLSACGQGGTSPTPVPVPVPVPDPTPMPPPTPVCPNADATSTQTYDGVTSVLQYGYSSSATVYLLKPPVFDSPLGFSPSTQTYTYRVNSDLLTANVPESASFFATGSAGPTLPATGNANFNVYSFSCPSADRSSITGALRLFDDRAGSNRLALRYTGFGSYTFSVVQGSVIGPSSTNDFRAFGYGAESARASVPLTGTVTFTGAIAGLAAQDNIGPQDVFRVLGSFTVIIDFATGGVSGSVTPVFDPAELNPNRAAATFDTYPIIPDGTAALPRFTGHFADGGKIIGFLSGPGADEMAINIQLPTTRLVSQLPRTTTIVASGAGIR
jgi:hypothetical protein